MGSGPSHYPPNLVHYVRSRFHCPKSCRQLGGLLGSSQDLSGFPNRVGCRSVSHVEMGGPGPYLKLAVLQLGLVLCIRHSARREGCGHCFGLLFERRNSLRAEDSGTWSGPGRHVLQASRLHVCLPRGSPEELALLQQQRTSTNSATSKVDQVNVLAGWMPGAGWFRNVLGCPQLPSGTSNVPGGFSHGNTLPIVARRMRWSEESEVGSSGLTDSQSDRMYHLRKPGFPHGV